MDFFANHQIVAWLIADSLKDKCAKNCHYYARKPITPIFLNKIHLFLLLPARIRDFAKMKATKRRKTQAIPLLSDSLEIFVQEHLTFVLQGEIVLCEAQQQEVSFIWL